MKSLASRTQFEVLGLKASSPRKLPCPRLEDSTIFERLKFCWKTPETLRKICKELFLVSSSRDQLKKNFLKTFFLRSPEKNSRRPFFFWRTLASVSLVLSLGLKRVCPWPWPQNFLCSSLEPCALDSTSVISSKNCYFQIIIKNLTKCNIFSTFAFKNYRKFTNHNLEKLC